MAASRLDGVIIASDKQIQEENDEAMMMTMVTGRTRNNLCVYHSKENSLRYKNN